MGKPERVFGVEVGFTQDRGGSGPMKEGGFWVERFVVIECFHDERVMSGRE